MHEDLITCGHALAAKRLIWGYSGNISMRIEPNVFAISAGGTDLGNLCEDDLIFCQINSEEFQGKKHPSMETGLHRNIYRACQNASAVIHAQPLYATIVACSDLEIRTDFLPEAMAYLGSVERVPYHHAGSYELAVETANKAANNPVLLLNNHGTVCWGASLSEALINTETLEFLCQLLVISRNSGIEFNYLGKHVKEDFRQHLRDSGRLG